MEEVAIPPSAFQGEGNSLRKGAKNSASSPAPASAAAQPDSESKPDPWANLGSGNTLNSRKRAAEKAPAREPTPPPQDDEVIDATMLDEDDFMFGEDYDDEDYIEVDSD